MAHMASKRFTLFLAMAVAMTLSGCVVEGGGGHGHVDPPPPPPPVPSYPGCPALLGPGSSGVISLYDWRGDDASFESYIAPDFYIRHYDGQEEVAASRIYSELDMDDATFRIVPGLADDRCISFEASNYPGYFLRHRGSDIVLDPDNHTLGYSEDATFCPRPGLAASSELSFESCNAPDAYINIDDYDGRTYGLYLDDEYSAEFEEDATFLLMPPW